MDFHVFLQVHASRISRQTYPIFYCLIGCCNNEYTVVTQLALTWVELLNSNTLASTCLSLDQSERKSIQVYPKTGQKEPQVDPSFNVRLLATLFGASTSFYLCSVSSLISPHSFVCNLVILRIKGAELF